MRSRPAPLRATALAITAALCAASASAQVASAPDANRRPQTAGSLSGSPASERECAALRKRYLDSQACFEHYRLANGGLKPGATKACKNVVDPSPRCGQDLPDK